MAQQAEHAKVGGQGADEVKVFIAESNSPEDFFVSRLDGRAARAILDASGIAVDYRIVVDREMLQRAVHQAGHFEADIFHLSCHGDSEGIRLTSGEDVGWPELARLLQRFARLDRSLVYASCGGGDVGAAKAFQKVRSRFGFICGSRHPDGVGYFEACVSWSLLYNAMTEGTRRIRRIRTAIDNINLVVDGDFVYRRWDVGRDRYLSYPTGSGR